LRRVIDSLSRRASGKYGDSAQCGDESGHLLLRCLRPLHFPTPGQGTPIPNWRVEGGAALKKAVSGTKACKLAGNKPAAKESFWCHVPGAAMSCISVMCLECGLRGELSYGIQQFDDPRGQCIHRLEPAACPALKPSLIGASRILDLMAWDQFMLNEESPMRLSEPLQTEGAIVFGPDKTEPSLEEPRLEESPVHEKSPVYKVDGIGRSQAAAVKQ
jgi:hypothetical protein